MRCTFNTRTLTAVLRTLVKVAPNRSPKPVLETVHIRAHRDGVILTATDLDVSARVDVPHGKTWETGSLCVHPKALLKALPTPKESDEVTIETDDTGRLIVRGKSLAVLPTMDASLFPENLIGPIPSHSVGYLSVRADLLALAFDRARPFVDLDSTRFALSGIALENDSTRLIATSTDGRRLMSSRVEASPNCDFAYWHEDKAFVLPIKASIPVADLCRKSTVDVQVYRIRETATNIKTGETSGADDIAVRFVVGPWMIESRPIEGRFPAWRQVIPSGYSTRLLADPAELASLAKQAVSANETIDDTANDPVLLSCLASDPHALELSVSRGDAEHYRAQLDTTQREGPALDVSLDSRSLLDVGKALAIGADGKVEIRLIDHKSPVLLADETSTCIVMPLNRDEPKPEPKASKPEPAEQPEPTPEPEPIDTPEPAETPEPIEEMAPVSGGAPVDPEPTPDPEPAEEPAPIDPTEGIPYNVLSPLRAEMQWYRHRAETIRRWASTFGMRYVTESRAQLRPRPDREMIRQFIEIAPANGVDPRAALRHMFGPRPEIGGPDPLGARRRPIRDRGFRPAPAPAPEPAEGPTSDDGSDIDLTNHVVTFDGRVADRVLSVIDTGHPACALLDMVPTALALPAPTRPVNRRKVEAQVRYILRQRALRAQSGPIPLPGPIGSDGADTMPERPTAGQTGRGYTLLPMPKRRPEGLVIAERIGGAVTLYPEQPPADCHTAPTPPPSTIGHAPIRVQVIGPKGAVSEYACTVLDRRAGRYLMHSPRGEEYTVSEFGGDVPTCDCPAYRHQAEDIASPSCKHVRGLQSAGLLDPIAAPVPPDVCRPTSEEPTMPEQEPTQRPFVTILKSHGERSVKARVDFPDSRSPLCIATNPAGLILWSDDWCRIEELADAGLATRKHMGPATYGAVEYRWVGPTSQTTAPDLCRTEEPASP